MKKLIFLLPLLFVGCFWAPALPTFNSFDMIRSDNGTTVTGCEYLEVGIGKDVDLKDLCNRLGCDHGYGPVLRTLLGIYEDVQKVSGMTHELTGRQRVVIYKSRKIVQDTYGNIFGDLYKDEVLAFYWGRKDTVVIAETDLCKSLIAHEMTHMLIDLCNKGLTNDEEESLALKVEFTLADQYGE